MFFLPYCQVPLRNPLVSSSHLFSSSVITHCALRSPCEHTTYVCIILKTFKLFCLFLRLFQVTKIDRIMFKLVYTIVWSEMKWTNDVANKKTNIH